MMLDVGNKKCNECGELLRAQTVHVHERWFNNRRTKERDKEYYLRVVYNCPEHGNHVEPDCDHDYRKMPSYMFDNIYFCRKCGYCVRQDSSG